MTESTTATTSKTRRGGKRGNGEGNIRQRPDGLWEARISLEDGRRKSLYGKTRQEVASKLAKTTHVRDAGLPIVRSERQTVAAYLESWLAAVEGRVKPRTHKRYGELIRLYVLPTLGRVALAKLTAAQLEALYTSLLKRGLSPRRFITSMPSCALRWGARSDNRFFRATSLPLQWRLACAALKCRR